MRNSWLILSVIGLITISMMVILQTQLVRHGLSPAFVLLIVCMVIAAGCIAQLLIGGGIPKSVSAWQWVLLLSAGILSTVGNLALVKAYGISPNPGLVTTILGLQGGLVAVIAVMVLRDKLNTIQLIGLILGLVGAAIIGWGSRTNDTAILPRADKPSVAAVKKSRISVP